MSESMLERASKVMQHEMRAAALKTGAAVTPWEVIARAVLEELKKPTDAMKVAGGLKCEAIMFEGEGSGVIFDDMGTVFTTMIDAALSETRKP